MNNILFWEEIQTEAAKHERKLDPFMIAAIVFAESNFNPNAVSPCGAVGLMQLMPGTDKWLDGDIDGKDPVGNLDNGCQFLAQLRHWVEKNYPYGEILNQPWDEGWKLVWACYNWGMGNIEKMMKKSREENGNIKGLLFECWEKYVPRETSAYVVKIAKRWQEYITGAT